MSKQQVNENVKSSDSHEHSEACKCKGCEFWAMASSVEEAEEKYINKWFNIH